MAETNGTGCTCPTCGATAEPLLRTTGTLARRLDGVALGGADASRRIVLFGDLRKAAKRLPWRPQITLMAGLAPAAVMLMQKAAASVVLTMLPMSESVAAEPAGQATIQLIELFPYVATASAILSVVIAAIQWVANERYEERRQWLDAIANRIGVLQGLASRVHACGYCNSLHVGDARLEATADNLRGVLAVNQDAITANQPTVQS